MSTPLKIDYRNISLLIPNPKNPRKHDREQIRLLTLSIKENGFNVPILIDRDGTVIAGHARLMAAKKLRISEVPTICLDHLTDSQARAFMIADNRLCEISQWDDALLAEQLKILSEADLDFSLETTGFSMGAIDLRIQGLSSPVVVNEDPADKSPPLAAEAVTKPGDIWVLNGRHRILCGNALERESYYRLMDSTLAHVVFADSPYNVKIDGHVGGLGSIHHRDFAMAAGEMSKREFTSFLTTVFSLLARHSIDGSIHFQCIDWRHLSEMMEAGHLAYTELKNICVWVKDNGGMGSFYRSRHEMIAVFKSGKAPHRNNIELGRHGRYRTNIWEYPGVNSFSRKTEEGNLLTVHPTVKPVALVADAILDCSARGDIVLDPFLGSGTTLMASERVGRTCYGMELDPRYVDATLRRWQTYTGGEVEHAVTGRGFANSVLEQVVRHA